VSCSSLSSKTEYTETKTMSVLCIVFALTVTNLFSVPGVSGNEDFCVMDTFHSNSTWLQFTKELSSREYAMEQKFKSLHCCARGYRSIEW
jgi:hypothetical protein